MNVKFVAPAVLVKSIAVSKKFYEHILGQKIEMDNGEHVSFEGGFSIWQGNHAFEMIYGKDTRFNSTNKERHFELYFESDKLDETWKKLESHEIEVIHGIHEHPWGQRGFRILDPDSNIIEISEPLSVVVKRFRDGGMGDEEISKHTSIPLNAVQEMLEN